MNTLSFRTKSANDATVTRDWHIVDATNLTLGRMSAKIAAILRGKNKPYYTPHTDCGDYIIVINAKKVALTGKKWDDKEYLTYSGYPGGQKHTTVRELMAKSPNLVIERAVRGMLPRTRLGREQFRNLFVYVGDQHPHEAQQPKTVKINL